MEIYRETARRRAQAHKDKVAARRTRAWEVAHQAATLLKETYGAARVVAFGSLVTPHLFHLRSDIDLAVWGLDEGHYYRAVSHLLSLEPQISVDLLIFELVSPGLQKRIEREGQEL